MRRRSIPAPGVLSGIIILLSALAPAAIGAEPLNWQSAGGYRFAPVTVPATGRTGFTLLSAEETGIQFSNRLTLARAAANHNLMNGSGVAAGDIDGDGWCDLYFCNLEGPNVLYRNLGDWRFEEIAAESGVACENLLSRGAVFADVNGDGHLDLLVTTLGDGMKLFLNDGRGRFTDATADAGLTLRAGSTSIAVADVDGDGDLDVYLANYGETSILRSGGRFSTRIVNGRTIVTGRYANRLKIVDNQIYEYGEPDVLYLNDGNARFQSVSWTDGAFLDEQGQPLDAAEWDFGLAVQMRDINGDGHTDIYVCNDFQTPDRIWLNDGQGRFRAIPTHALRHLSYASMGVDFADIDRDERLDFFVVEMLSREHHRRIRQSSPMNPEWPVIGVIDNRPLITRNTLFWNRGDGTYAEIAPYSGVAASDWSWQPVFMDVDLDGYEDILITNGHAHDVNDMDMASLPATPGIGTRRSRRNIEDYPRLETPNAAFHNRRDRTFTDVTADWGFDSTQISHGIALADLDNDGDLDVAVNCLNTPALILRNESAEPRILVRLRGNPSNVQGLAARIRVTGGPVTQSQEIIGGGRYLSGDDPVRMFAAGSLTNRLGIEVTWPDGSRSEISGVRPNAIYEIHESSARPPESPRAPEPSPTPLFTEATALINHRHTEPPFDDFARQPLLHRRLSQLGPGIAWADLDGDGHDELIIGSGQGGSLGVFRNDGRGGFNPWNDPAWDQPAERDQTTLLAVPTTPGNVSLLVGTASYEDGLTNRASARHLSIHESSVTVADGIPDLPGGASAGPLAIADIDGDGDLDLFVGGRVVPGRYPESAPSMLFLNDNGRFLPDPDNRDLLSTLGLVSGAVFSDLTGNGLPDLVLACEWGPVRILINEDGRFSDATAAFGLADLTGWWNSVATGDFNGDGRPDIIAGNWGLNSSYQTRPGHPLLLYHGSLSPRPGLDLIEARRDPTLDKIVPRRDLNVLSSILPFVRGNIPSHAAYGRAGIEEILGEHLTKLRRVEAVTLTSSLFLNRGGHFESVELPAEAQWAPVFGICVADLDGDGNEDVFLAQNFFALQAGLHRQDTGRGLWLKGDGSGHLTVVPGHDSGVLIHGEQRGAAVGDFDGDGRVDLAVTQNGAATKLLRNSGARPGIRIRLHGPERNPSGIGAMIRLKFGDRLGPAREVQAGSGYWSQNSLVPVMGSSDRPAAVEVRWPGGRTTTTPVADDARTVAVRHPDAAGN